VSGSASLSACEAFCRLGTFVIGEQVAPSCLADLVLHGELGSASLDEPRGSDELLMIGEELLGSSDSAQAVDHLDPDERGEAERSDLGDQFATPKLKVALSRLFIRWVRHLQTGDAIEKGGAIRKPDFNGRDVEGPSTGVAEREIKYRLGSRRVHSCRSDLFLTEIIAKGLMTIRALCSARRFSRSVLSGHVQPRSTSVPLRARRSLSAAHNDGACLVEVPWPDPDRCLARRVRGKWIGGSVASIVVATTGSDKTGFSDVDASGGPDYFIEYLDGARRQPVIAQSKEWSLQQLHLERGHRALDVGCGTGEDVVAMAALVGPTGEAIGLDSSQAMIAEAAKRHRQVPQVSFVASDAHRLPFESASFDGCRAERTLQHVSDPGQVMREITRILKGGGRVALVEPDWETLIIEGSDPAVSAVIWRHHMKRHRHPRIGRSLRGAPDCEWIRGRYSCRGCRDPHGIRTFEACIRTGGGGLECDSRWAGYRTRSPDVAR
jgi:SAM-dependent methyltransferase